MMLPLLWLLLIFDQKGNGALSPCTPAKSLENFCFIILCEFSIFDQKENEIKYKMFLQANWRCPLATPSKMFNNISLCEF